jgi:hypothetical protein
MASRVANGPQPITIAILKSSPPIDEQRWNRGGIGYDCILRAIMHNDFPLKQPRIGDRVYFINQSRHIILHMYDDRGLDVIAPQIDVLRLSTKLSRIDIASTI